MDVRSLERKEVTLSRIWSVSKISSPPSPELTATWAGNVRELQNIIERGVALCRNDRIEVSDLPDHVRENKNTDILGTALARRMSLAELEREYILLVLDDEGGNKTQTAKRLGLDRKTLYRKLEEYRSTTE